MILFVGWDKFWAPRRRFPSFLPPCFLDLPWWLMQLALQRAMDSILCFIWTWSSSSLVTAWYVNSFWIKFTLIRFFFPYSVFVKHLYRYCIKWIWPAFWIIVMCALVIFLSFLTIFDQLVDELKFFFVFVFHVSWWYDGSLQVWYLVWQNSYCLFELSL